MNRYISGREPDPDEGCAAGGEAGQRVADPVVHPAGALQRHPPRPDGPPDPCHAQQGHPRHHAAQQGRPEPGGRSPQPGGWLLYLLALTSFLLVTFTEHKYKHKKVCIEKRSE